MSLDEPPPSDFKYEIKRRVVLDCYLDASKIIVKKNYDLSILAGIALCGLNTNYSQITALGNGPYTYEKMNKNFVFPAITTGVGMQRGPVYAEIKLGYCWNDPRLINTPFLFPEISINYELFSW
jgi:hypothetical protein